MNSPPITVRAAAPITQVGTMARAGRYGAADALPVRRQRGIGRRPLARDDRVEVLAQAVELARAARRQPVPAQKAEAEAEIHQLQHRQVGAGMLPAAGVEHVEEALAAA